LDEGAVLFSLLLEALSTPLPYKEHTLLIHRIWNHSLSIMIKTSEPQIKEHINSTISKLQFPPLRFTKGSLDVEDNSYLSYLLLDNSKEKQEDLLNIINTEIKKYKDQQNTLQTLRFHLPRPTKTLDPRIIIDRTASAVIKMLYEGLMSISADGGLQLALAESVEISEDKKSYTFTLRESFWSNQTPLTAYDFEYAWKSIIDPGFSSPYSFLFFPIKNAELAKKGRVPLDQVGIYSLDDKHLLVELEYITPHFLQLTASSFFSPLWHGIDKRYPGWAYYSEKQYVCNGPFKLDMWKMNNDMTFVKNSYYWKAQSVKLDKILINVIESDHSAVELFKQKKLDWLGDPLSKVPLSQIEAFSQKKELISDDVSIFFLFQFNIKYQLFQSQKVRKAFSYAVNRANLIKQLSLKNDTPLLRFYLSDEAPPFSVIEDANEQLALHLFEEGLKEFSLTRKDVSPICISHSELDEQEAICRLVGTMWEKLFNIEITYKRIPWTTYFKKVLHNDYMVAGFTWYKRYDDPIYLLDIITQNFGETNLTPWHYPQYFSLIKEAKRAENQIQKQEYLLAAEHILLEEMPFIPVLEQKSRYVKNSRLKNVYLSNAAIINFSEAYLTNEEES
jgi:oligopeptide transport system substrate-binding protein